MRGGVLPPFTAETEVRNTGGGRRGLSGFTFANLTSITGAGGGRGGREGSSSRAFTQLLEKEPKAATATQRIRDKCIVDCWY